MSRKTRITPNGRVEHQQACNCEVCQKVRGDACEQCGGPVLVVESETAYARVCQHCQARGTVPKAKYLSRTMPDESDSEWRDPRTLKEFAEELARSSDELADARMELAHALFGVLDAGVPLTMAVDYWMLEIAGVPREEWARRRACTDANLRKHLRQARERLDDE